MTFYEEECAIIDDKSLDFHQKMERIIENIVAYVKTHPRKDAPPFVHCKILIEHALFEMRVRGWKITFEDDDKIIEAVKPAIMKAFNNII
jgi:hypothetical protein